MELKSSLVLIMFGISLLLTSIAATAVPELSLHSETELHLAPETDRVGGCGATITDLKVGASKRRHIDIIRLTSD